MSKILVFGPARVVETLTVAALPEGALTEGTSYETVLGGQGETVAVALARLGVRSVFSGRVGDDSGGKRLARLLDTAGVDLSTFHVDRAAQTGHLVREVTPMGEERRIVFGGACRRLTEEEVKNAFLTAPDAACASAELAPAALCRIADAAADRGIPFFLLHTGGAPQPPALPSLEIYVTDEGTAEAVTGLRPGNADSCLQTAIELQKRIAARYYVIRLGERGAFLYDGVYCHMVNSYIVRETDARGADEAFFAALIAEYMRPEREILPALSCAAAASALAVTHAGEATSPPTAEELFSFLERN
ncbi:MAG: hypothetical protein IJF73_04665 [Clostridia bacterium]|nr:hypothetical protein [Clostridia bacterium]